MTLAFGGLTATTATASAASVQPRNSVTLTAVQGALPSDAVLVVAAPAVAKTVATTELAKSKSKKKKKGLSVVAILIILVLLGLLAAAVILVVLAMKRRGNDRH
ncbi:MULTISPECIES: hypothetical protein [unclassified Kitasatospora]|uniref:hypothetical protein n=1 Tax=unclassified Kitasatospora TaxID=2633591 RepID=UPI0012F8355A|nr:MULTISPECIES: hypothetical protein [unclassified Kitasatospora]